MKDFQGFTDPRMNEAAWWALDLTRAYAARDRAAIIEPSLTWSRTSWSTPGASSS
ncbi:hypothetical protein [Streptomyces xantholiticus]|uniref:hypothetical protein n=1 Tax=Streptomyces xantholiticus TaxID=68285 RepID=UPI00167A1827|nr:hypothetical protein [Streptomyces xantholiticus]GGW65306.1 hypothetical protein GCM10010381_57860 [Streptomyces xantholiticus]